MKWTIGRRIIFGFALVITLAAITLFLILRQVHVIDNKINNVTVDCLPGTEAMSQITINTVGNLELLLRHVVEKEPAKMQEIIAARTKVWDDVSKLYEAYDKTITLPEDRRMFDEMKRLRGEWREAGAKVIALSAEGKKEEAFAVFPQAKEAFDKLKSQCLTLLEFNQHNSEKAVDEMDHAGEAAVTTVWTGLIVAIAASVLTAFLILKRVNGDLTLISSNLDQASDQVGSAASQVSSASQQLAAGASQQAASLEETSASMEEMSSMVQNNAGNAKTCKELVVETSQTTQESSDRMNELKQTVERVQQSSKEMTTAMDAIKDSSGSIFKIIKTIDEIAFQTNILALNAAVEAARAGEAGMGFAVVADEVRNLAKRSVDAARETSQMIEDSINRSQAGVRVNEGVVTLLAEINQKADLVDTGLREILSKVQRVNDAVGQVSNASQEQSQGISQINIALTQMDKVTQSNAATAEETASASEQLSAQAMEMKESVNHLLEMIGARTSHTAKAAPALVARPASLRTAPAVRSQNKPQALLTSSKPKASIPLPSSAVPKSSASGFMDES